ncbi:unnamed protein product [Pleuronectes platessa]|uniref:Uncharacterized protein n=1 Tax=Pleuronectes platessa TaxID=8262 RepID=A0A9N7U814_PLEPL|nr:unnamed protein product [Pleuronectes platessa]
MMERVGGDREKLCCSPAGSLMKWSDFLVRSFQLLSPQSQRYLALALCPAQATIPPNDYDFNPITRPGGSDMCNSSITGRHTSVTSRYRIGRIPLGPVMRAKKDAFIYRCTRSAAAQVSSCGRDVRELLMCDDNNSVGSGVPGPVPGAPVMDGYS